MLTIKCQCWDGLSLKDSYRIPLDSTEWLAEYSGVKRRQINKAFFDISEKVILCETQNR